MARSIDVPSDSDAAIANMNLGAGYLRQGNTELAIERLRRALVQDPRLVDAHSTIAVAYDQIGKLEDAELTTAVPRSSIRTTVARRMRTPCSSAGNRYDGRRALFPPRG